MSSQRIGSMLDRRRAQALETGLVAMALALGGGVCLLPQSAKAAELVMFESKSCVICQRFQREIGADRSVKVVARGNGFGWAGESSYPRGTASTPSTATLPT